MEIFNTSIFLWNGFHSWRWFCFAIQSNRAVLILNRIFLRMYHPAHLWMGMPPNEGEGTLCNLITNYNTSSMPCWHIVLNESHWIDTDIHYSSPKHFQCACFNDSHCRMRKSHQTSYWCADCVKFWTIPMRARTLCASIIYVDIYLENVTCSWG